MTFNCRAAAHADLPQLKELWTEVFDEDEKAVELFFERNKNIMHAYLAEQDGLIRAAVYLIDCKLNGMGANYLCGAATLPGFRNHGVMTALIGFALNDARRRGDSYSVLIPAQPWLYGYYSRFGYEPRGARELITLSRGEMRSGAHGAGIGFDEKDSLVYTDSFIGFACDYYACYGCKTLKSPGAIAVIEENGGEAFVIFSIYNDIKELYSLLLSGSSAKSVTLSRPSKSALPPRGMICRLGEHALPETVFVGITLE